MTGATVAQWLVVITLSSAVALVGVANSVAISAPSLAASLNPLATEAHVALAVMELGGGKGAGPEEATARLDWLRVIAPGDARQASLRGYLTEVSGDISGAGAQYLEALNLQPTEQLALRQLLLRDLEAGSPRALEWLDVLLRRHTGLRELLTPALVAVLKVPALAEALRERLAGLPPWRPWVLSLFSGAPDTVDFTASVLSDDIAAGRLSRGHMAPLERTLFQLANFGRTVDAYGLYSSYLVATGAGGARYVNDPEFASTEELGPFSWRRHKVPGTIIGPGDNGFGLKIRFTDSPSRGALVTQQTLLPEGKYSLKSAMTTESLVAPKGLFWRLTCGDGRVVLSADLPSGTASVTLSETFEVPADCQVQTLSLASGAKTTQRQNAYRGGVHIEGLEITRVPG